MYFQQFYLGCLAQASYLIGSGGEAAVVPAGTWTTISRSPSGKGSRSAT